MAGGREALGLIRNGNGPMAWLLALQRLYHCDYAWRADSSAWSPSSKGSKRATTKPWRPAPRDGKTAPTTSLRGCITIGDLEFFKVPYRSAVLRAYQEFAEPIGTMERGSSTKGNRVRAEILKRHLPFSILDIEAATGCASSCAP
jgi:hypothetical protein